MDNRKGIGKDVDISSTLEILNLHSQNQDLKAENKKLKSKVKYYNRMVKTVAVGVPLVCTLGFASYKLNENKVNNFFEKYSILENAKPKITTSEDGKMEFKVTRKNDVTSLSTSFKLDQMKIEGFEKAFTSQTTVNNFFEYKQKEMFGSKNVSFEFPVKCNFGFDLKALSYIGSYTYNKELGINKFILKLPPLELLEVSAYYDQINWDTFYSKSTWFANVTPREMLTNISLSLDDTRQALGNDKRLFDSNLEESKKRMTNIFNGYRQLVCGAIQDEEPFDQVKERILSAELEFEQLSPAQYKVLLEEIQLKVDEEMETIEELEDTKVTMTFGKQSDKEKSSK